MTRTKLWFVGSTEATTCKSLVWCTYRSTDNRFICAWDQWAQTGAEREHLRKQNTYFHNNFTHSKLVMYLSLCIVCGLRINS